MVMRPSYCPSLLQKHQTECLGLCCMWLCTHMWECTRPCSPCGDWRRMAGVLPSRPLPYPLQTGSVTKPGAWHFGTRLHCPQGLASLLFLPTSRNSSEATGIQGHTWLLYGCQGSPSSGPHTYTTGSPTQWGHLPSPHTEMFEIDSFDVKTQIRRPSLLCKCLWHRGYNQKGSEPRTVLNHC